MYRFPSANNERMIILSSSFFLWNPAKFERLENKKINGKETLLSQSVGITKTKLGIGN